MPITTKPQAQAESAATVRILEQKANFEQSKAKGRLLTLDELPEFLSTRMKELEGTESYRQTGYVWFYLGTVGTTMNGAYGFNPTGRTLEEMFKRITEDEYCALPSTDRARFTAGDKPVAVYLRHDEGVGDRRVVVFGDAWVKHVAPVVVVKSEPELKEAARE